MLETLKAAATKRRAPEPEAVSVVPAALRGTGCPAGSAAQPVSTSSAPLTWPSALQFILQLNALKRLIISLTFQEGRLTLHPRLIDAYTEHSHRGMTQVSKGKRVDHT